MQRWEYAVVEQNILAATTVRRDANGAIVGNEQTFKITTSEGTTEQAVVSEIEFLNPLGKAGWELISKKFNPRGFILKRPLF